MRLHVDQVEISTDTVRRLVAAQFPQWRDLPIRPVTSHGTVHALFRLGKEIVLRFPLRPHADPDLRQALISEQDNARRIAAHVPVRVPEPLGLGAPGEGYPGPWTVYRWIEGEPAREDNIADLDLFAKDLAEFVSAFHAMDTAGRGWNGRTRGGPLHDTDEYVRRYLAEGKELVDTRRLIEMWERSLQIPHATKDVWLHADLMPGNLLVRDGRLAAVIDLETVCIGDPAEDLAPAWNLLTAKARHTYRRALGVDDATWERSKGLAIRSIGGLVYYATTNKTMFQTCQRTLHAVLADG